MMNNTLVNKVINNAERKGYEAVAKMTGLELAKIEVDEMHPLYEYACEEIDARSRGKDQHALTDFDRQDEWDRSFEASQMRSLDRLWEANDQFERDGGFDDLFTAAAGFVDPEDYSERVNDFHA